MLNRGDKIGIRKKFSKLMEGYFGVPSDEHLEVNWVIT